MAVARLLPLQTQAKPTSQTSQTGHTRRGKRRTVVRVLRCDRRERARRAAPRHTAAIVQALAFDRRVQLEELGVLLLEPFPDDAGDSRVDAVLLERSDALRPVHALLDGELDHRVDLRAGGVGGTSAR